MSNSNNPAKFQQNAASHNMGMLARQVRCVFLEIEFIFDSYGCQVEIFIIKQDITDSYVILVMQPGKLYMINKLQEYCY